VAEIARNDRPALPLKENPLRERRTIVRRYVRNSLIGVLLVAMAYHIFVVETDWARMGGIAEILSTTAEFLPNLAFFPTILQPLLETLLLAFWGTTIATLVALPVAYLAARNVTPYYPLTYPFGRAIIVISRSVHELIFALLFVAAPGLGAFPGILALACRSIGFMSKTTAEALEITPEEASAAVRACRALGLNVAGVDMLRSSRGPVLIEVNSTPGLKGIEQSTGLDIAGQMIAFLETHAKPALAEAQG